MGGWVGQLGRWAGQRQAGSRLGGLVGRSVEGQVGWWAGCRQVDRHAVGRADR